MKLFNFFDRLILKFLTPYVSRIIKKQWNSNSLYNKVTVGQPGKLYISDSADVVNALFNLNSGNISIHDNVFFGHNVCCVTGTHDYRKIGVDRKESIPREGRDIVIKDGVWVGTNVTIIGPCTIGENAVIAAGAVVVDDVPAMTIYGGVPARMIKKIEYENT